MAILLVSLTLLGLYLFYHLYYKRRLLPPGPTPLPLLGNMLQIGSSARARDNVFVKWRREYGPVFTFWMANVPVVCVADYQTMVDTFVKDGDTFAGRCISESDRRTGLIDDKHGIVFTSGDVWREQRRFALHTFRDFGVGKNVMQEQILEELDALFSKIDANLAHQQSEEEETNLADMFDLSVGSTLNQLLFGHKLEGDRETEFWEIKKLFTDNMVVFGSVSFHIWALRPALFDHIPPFWGIRKRIAEGQNRFEAFLNAQIREHQQQQQRSQTEPPGNFVDAFLGEMERHQQQGNSDYYNIDQLKAVCSDLWFAGQESTSFTLVWALAFMLHKTECMERLNTELKAVIGTDRMVTMEDKPNLPYTNAVINESLRVVMAHFLNINHSVTRDVCLEGYWLPQGTCIVNQLVAIASDDSIFENPDNYNPDRFIDQNGQLKNSEELIAFGVGKRQCIGQAQARMELFLFIANVFNRYRISPGKVLPLLDRQLAFFVKRPAEFSCRVAKLR